MLVDALRRRNLMSARDVCTGMRFFVLLAAMLVLSSCGTVTGATDGAPDLDGRTFLSTGVTEDGAPSELVDGSRIRISFDDGQLSAGAGCNTMLGGYRVDGGTLVVDAMGMTEMGCPQDLMEQDTWLADLLGSGPTVALDGDELTLTSAGTAITLLDRVVADPDRPLVGTVWRVESLVSGDAVSSTPTSAEATLSFREDGTVEVHGGCNQGSSPYTTGDGTLTVGEVVMTAQACDDARGDLEEAVVHVLDAGDLGVEITADRLTLTAGDGTGLVLRAG